MICKVSSRPVNARSVLSDAMLPRRDTKDVVEHPATLDE